jgi:hypothetical protein
MDSGHNHLNYLCNQVLVANTYLYKTTGDYWLQGREETVYQANVRSFSDLFNQTHLGQESPLVKNCCMHACDSSLKATTESGHNEYYCKQQ